MKRIVLTLSDNRQAQALDRLVAEFADDLARRTSECMFYMSQPGAERPARVIETETQETLDRFVAFVQPRMRERAV